MRDSKTISEREIEYLMSRDKIFRGLVDQLGYIEYEKRDLDFRSLVKIIVGQQLSGKAAGSIYGRLVNSLGGWDYFYPDALVNICPSTLRQAGISKSKMKFIKDLAYAYQETPDLTTSWESMADEEALEEIQKLNGFGPWSSSIVTLFYLGRKDIFPKADTTLNKAYYLLYGDYLSHSMIELDWARPYRGLLAMYFWKWMDSGVEKSA